MKTSALPPITAARRMRNESHVRHLLDAWNALGSPPLRTVCECAVGPGAQVSAFHPWSKRSLYIEPDPKMAALARKAYPWAEVVEVAIAGERGEARLRQLNGQSYVCGTPWAPTFEVSKARARAASRVTVKSVPFSDVDDGEIDLINIDCEGSEWFVLATMESRPLLVQIELYPKNAHHFEISDWFGRNGYTVAASWGNSNLIYQRQ